MYGPEPELKLCANTTIILYGCLKKAVEPG